MMNRLSDKLRSTSTTANLISDETADQLLSASLGSAPLAVPLQCQIFFGVTAIYLEEKLAFSPVLYHDIKKAVTTAILSFFLLC